MITKILGFLACANAGAAISTRHIGNAANRKEILLIVLMRKSLFMELAKFRL